MSTPKNIIFFHPDLGIGGAERLVIDAAVGLQSLGHKVTIFTSHCDPSHCFDEARDGTLDVRVRGNSIFPVTLFGRFKILFAILRHYHMLLWISFNGELGRLKPTVFFVDQLSAGIPLMRYVQPNTHILFYCHFPDLLLVQQRQSWTKRTWRLPFDLIEGWSMRGADRVVVNSHFTKGIVESVWGGLGGQRGIGVIYPCVNTTERRKEKGAIKEIQQGAEKPLWEGKKVLLSINRFERKKDVGLAINAFAGLAGNDRKGARLVIAGGYDSRVQENVSYHNELVSLAENLGLRAATTKNFVTALNVPTNIEVLFLLSVPNQLKSMLLSSAKLLIYTPSNEHFGIVPLEAMLAGVPVLAANSGGPLETVVEARTGWLRSPEKASAWTEVMQQVLQQMPDNQLKKIGAAGRERVTTEFSESKMASRMDLEMEEMSNAPRIAATELQDILLAVGVGGMLLFIVAALFVERSGLFK
ncbi:Alpha-1,3-mannosyltransferase-like protein [Trapelia coarctata]|nr:Alpha-1,3-mannosyltransferase-like protein [Trapelia coarctata]